MMNLIYLLEAILFIYTSYLTGLLVLDWLKMDFHRIFKKVIYSIIIGYGLIANLGLASTIFGFHKNWYFFIIFILITLFNRKKIYAHSKFILSRNIFSIFIKLYDKFIKSNKFLYLILFFWVLSYTIITLLPWSFSDDGLYYHLPFVLEIIDINPISFPLSNSLTYGHLPILVEILYSIPVIIFKNFIVTRIIQFSALILLLFACLDFTYKYIKNKNLILLLSVLILSNMPLIRASLEGGMIDIFTFLFGISSSILLFEVILDKKNNQNKVALSGILLGLALSTKYLALFFCLINFIFLVYFHLSEKYSLKQLTKSIIFYIFPIIIISSFWYLKNIFYTSNPLFPMFTNTGGLSYDIGRFTIDRAPYNFFLFPFSFWGLNSIFKLPYAVLNAFYFVAIYISLLFLAFMRKISKQEILLFLYMEIFLGLLFYWSHQVRFAAPALLVANILIVFLFDKIIDTFSVFKKKVIIYSVTCILSLVFFIISLNTFSASFICVLSFNNVKCTTPKSIFYLNYNKTELLNKYLSAYSLPLNK